MTVPVVSGELRNGIEWMRRVADSARSRDRFAARALLARLAELEALEARMIATRDNVRVPTVRRAVAGHIVGRP